MYCDVEAGASVEANLSSRELLEVTQIQSADGALQKFEEGGRSRGRPGREVSSSLTQQRWWKMAASTGGERSSEQRCGTYKEGYAAACM